MQWFEQSPKKLLIPRAWAVKPLDAMQAEGPVIFNLTFFVQAISEFLQAHNLKNAFMSIGLAEGMLWEQLRWVENRNPALQEVVSSQDALVWNYTHVVSNEYADKHPFYMFGVAREILFQYQLLALQVPCNIICITSKKRALLHAIALNQISLSPTLSDELELFSRCCATMLDLFDYEAVFENSSHFKTFFEEEKEAVCAALGLFLLGKDDGF
jgi:hypothetical protein